MRTTERRPRYGYPPDSLALNRPVRRPTDAEARTALARDLSRGWRGVSEGKALRLLRLPLMEVALEGANGADLAEAIARRRLVA